MGSCHYCGPTDRELRPYGPGGAGICFPCMKATPEREASAKQAFGAQLDAAVAISPVGITVASASGPQPYMPGDIPGVDELIAGDLDDGICRCDVICTCGGDYG